jgi:hypothetical protein
VVDHQNLLVADNLRDGTPVTIRAIRPDDSGLFLEAFSKLGRESIYTRFFSCKRELTGAELKQLTDVDFDHVVALMVTTRAVDGETMIAEGRYITSRRPAVPKSPSRPRRISKAAGSPACC